MSETSVTAEAISSDLTRLGLKPGDAVLVHSSLKSIGFVEGGPSAVIKALIEAVGPKGTVLFPTLTGNRLLSPKNPPVFDVTETACWTGAIPEAARRYKGAVRSLHPTHSVAAVGPMSEKLCYAHEVSQTPCGAETPYIRLARMGGKVLFIGCDLESNTTYHGVEETVAVPYHMQKGWTDATIKTKKDVHTVRIRLHYYGPARHFNALSDKLVAAGIMKTGSVGKAAALLVQSGPMVEMATEALTKDPELFLADKEKGKGWCDGSRLPEV